MKLSDEGLRLIKSFEGYLREQPDGSCTAYLCPAGVATLGWGCTTGIKLGMRWTREQAEAGLSKELARFENAVTRLVTVPINQNEFDALVSFAFNCGEAALKGSTILRRLNKGDRAGAAKAFHLWNKATVKGKKVVLAGLVSRRAREASLFLKPIEAPDGPFMPHEVVPAETPVAEGTKTVAKAASLVGLGGVTLPNLPAPPDMTALTGWRGFGDSVAGLGGWAFQKPWLIGVIAVWVAGMIFLPKIAERFGWQRS